MFFVTLLLSKLPRFVGSLMEDILHINFHKHLAKALVCFHISCFRTTITSMSVWANCIKLHFCQIPYIYYPLWIQKKFTIGVVVVCGKNQQLYILFPWQISTYLASASCNSPSFTIWDVSQGRHSYHFLNSDNQSHLIQKCLLISGDIFFCYRVGYSYTAWIK
jgi:hypothetical protein